MKFFSGALSDFHRPKRDALTGLLCGLCAPRWDQASESGVCDSDYRARVAAKVGLGARMEDVWGGGILGAGTRGRRTTAFGVIRTGAEGPIGQEGVAFAYDRTRVG